MDITSKSFAMPVGGVEAIAFSKPVNKRITRRILNRSNRSICCNKISSRCATMDTMTAIVNSLVSTLATHYCVEVRQMKNCACNSYSDRIARIQAEEIDARNTIHRNIRPYIQFGKSGKPRNRWHSSWTHIAHAERHH